MSSKPATKGNPDIGDPTVYKMIRNIFFRRFSQRVEGAGIDPEDGIQEVLLRLYTRSISERSRWDPARGCLSNWIFTATSGIVINMVAKHKLSLLSGTVGLDGDVSASDPHRGEDLAPSISEPSAPSEIDWRTIEAVGEELDLPDRVIVGILSGEDPFVAGLEAGMSWPEAAALIRLLGAPSPLPLPRGPRVHKEPPPELLEGGEGLFNI